MSILEMIRPMMKYLKRQQQQHLYDVTINMENIYFHWKFKLANETRSRTRGMRSEC